MLVKLTSDHIDRGDDGAFTSPLCLAVQDHLRRHTVLDIPSSVADLVRYTYTAVEEQPYTAPGCIRIGDLWFRFDGDPTVPGTVMVHTDRFIHHGDLKGGNAGSPGYRFEHGFEQPAKRSQL